MNDGELSRLLKDFMSRVFSFPVFGLMFGRDPGTVGPILVPFGLAAFVVTDLVRSEPASV